MSNPEIARRISRAPNFKTLLGILDDLAPGHDFSVFRGGSRHYPSVLYRGKIKRQGKSARLHLTTICEGSFWDIRAALVQHFGGVPKVDFGTLTQERKHYWGLCLMFPGREPEFRKMTNEQRAELYARSRERYFSGPSIISCGGAGEVSQ